MTRNKNNTPSSIGNLKKIIFNLLIVLIPFILVLILELLLRAFSYGDNLNLFVNHPEKEFKAYRIVNPEIGKKYFQKFEYSKPPKDIFLKDKPDSCFRIFVMGSSSVVGFPYDNNIMFSRILHEWLRETYPGKKIEIVNTAITAISSFSLLDYMPQILKQKPDAILIYAGHNEFYGAFGAGSNEAATHNPTLIKLHLKMMNLRVYQLTRNIISGTVALVTKSNTASAKRGTLMSRMVKDADIIYDSKTYKEGIKNYRDNLNLMLAMAKSKNVPVFLSDMVSNIHDLKPFNSKASDKYKPAIDYFQAAQQLEANGNIAAAKENYTKARDYDCIRFRASSDINKIISELAKKYNNVHFVPSLSLFEANSPNGLVGSNLITEHVHPNIQGYFLLAESFYTAILQSKLIGGKINDYAPKTSKQIIINYGFTELDSLVAKHRITNLSYHWPFRDETKNYIDYRKIYQPVSHIDSLAFHVMADGNLILSDAHLQLAKEYEKNHDFENAFREYNALTKISPYWPLYFRKAGDCLIALRDLPGAIHYFSRSLEYDSSSFYAHFRLGELFMIKNDIDNAVAQFEDAYTLADKEKIKVLTRLFIAYSYRKDQGNIERINKEIQKFKPGAVVQVPPREYQFMNYIPVEVNDYIIRANDLLKDLKLDEAEKLLLESLKVKDNHISHRLLGEIYFKKKELDKSLYELKRVYADFNSDPNFLYMLSMIYLSSNQKQNAKSCIDRIELVNADYPGLEKLKSYIQ
jgi:tetratricopeptide (TPR) repeat protein